MPPDTSALLVRGRDRLARRLDAEAATCFEEALASAPASAAACVGLCTALVRLGRLAAALAVADDVLRRQPPIAGIEGVRAQILLLEGREEEAWRSVDRGCAEVPPDPIALFVRGLLLLQRSDNPAALSAFDAAIALDGSLAAAYLGRASALAREGVVPEALAAFQLAREADPHNAQVLVRLGHWLIQLSRFDAAAAAFADALAIDARNVAALRGRAQCLAAAGRAAQAVDAYTRLLAVEPDAPYMRGERLHLRLHCCDWRGFEEERRAIAEGVRLGERVDTPGSFLTHGESAADQLSCARIFAAEAFARPDRLDAAIRGLPGERYRIAYVSADFGAHATAYLAAGLFEAHDRSRFETFAISLGPDDGSAMRARLTRAFDHFEDVGARSDRDIAQRLQALGIDIAIDLKGHTLGARPGIFAYRPAPVQLSFLGYPGTLGTDCMDYLVADHTVVPAAERHHYVERMIYLPESYQVNDPSRAVGPPVSRTAAGLPLAGIVFCCFNNAYKIMPAVFDDWMQILRGVPGSILWLLHANETATANLRDAAQSRGVAPDRLLFAPWLPAPEHLARCALADVFLDTLPYNAHTTASDALWSGVPVVTRAGSGFASRVATSLLRTVGLGHLSVASRPAYVQLAVHLAQAPDELAALKRNLAGARAQSSLFDSARYARCLEGAFEEIIARARRGAAPADLEVRA